MVNTDASPCLRRHLRNLDNVDSDYQVVSHDIETCQRWLPWVHKFISNAKSWIDGTHHGIRKKYLDRYLSEFTYRFNRRHDVKSLFHRALLACAVAKPVKLSALC